MPDLVGLAERLRELALSLPETYEDEPWGHPVFKVSGNRMFASMSVGEDAVHLTVKLTPEEREIAQLLPYVHRARYVGRYGWVTAEVADDESLEAALEWLRESYWLKAPTSLRGAVEGDDEGDVAEGSRAKSSASGRGLPKPRASRAGAKRRPR
jgi:predicted DNA-binding protein (MmcQ/YjbR family)